MATGNTGFKFKDANGNIVDFYDVFEPYNGGDKASITNFKSGNTDLCDLFRAGDGQVNTGYKNQLNNDLGRLFVTILPFIPVGPHIDGITQNYYYAIFTDTNINTNKGIKSNQRFNYPQLGIALNFICVGGGGGGGGSRINATCGGGGGGGTYLNNIDGYKTADINIVVGAGGIGGKLYPNSNLGSSGGNSYVQYRYDANIYIVKCNGGSGGSGENLAGVGGKAFTGTTQVSLITGGNGGKQSNGSPSSYSTTNDPLSIPDELTQTANNIYISKYYGGGGGGGKGSDDYADYSGAQGGGTFGGVSSTWTNTGVGGTSSIKNAGAGPGLPGNGYGSGGGGGGYEKDGTGHIGGDGRQGIVIVYALLR
jgi:hypothetical protein